MYSAYKFNRVTKRFGRQMNGISEIVCGSKGKYILLSRRCHCYPKTLASFKSRLILPFCPFWYRLTQVVLAKGPLNVCMCVCVFFLGVPVVRFLAVQWGVGGNVGWSDCASTARRLMKESGVLRWCRRSRRRSRDAAAYGPLASLPASQPS